MDDEKYNVIIQKIPVLKAGEICFVSIENGTLELLEKLTDYARNKMHGTTNKGLLLFLNSKVKVTAIDTNKGGDL